MAISRIRKIVKRWIRSNGYELRKLSLGELDDITRLAEFCKKNSISTFLDIGANRGQFAIDLRMSGYKGRIISFEPLSQAHASLMKNASRDEKWTVAPRVAIGSVESECSINVSENSFSSSLLPMTNIHAESAPSSSYIGIESVSVRTLTSILKELGVSENETLALKIDTQGFEENVIDGARDILDRVQLIYTELSLVPVYEGSPNFLEMYNMLLSYKYRCIALSHEFSDPKTGEMLQVNGTFIH